MGVANAEMQHPFLFMQFEAYFFSKLLTKSGVSVYNKHNDNKL